MILNVFVFVFVSSYDFWIAFIISFQNMYGYRGLWGLRADIMIIFEVMTDRHTHRHTPIPLIDSAHPVGWAEWKISFLSGKFPHKKKIQEDAKFAAITWLILFCSPPWQPERQCWVCCTFNVILEMSHVLYALMVKPAIGWPKHVTLAIATPLRISRFKHGVMVSSFF